MMKNLIIVICASLFLTSCLAINKEGGISVGLKGNPAWIKTSTEQKLIPILIINLHMNYV